MVDGWGELDWEQRRERRFQKWLGATGVEFANAGVGQHYRDRVQSLMLLALGSPAEVEEYVTGPLETCATDGGFFLRSGTALDIARAESLKAMIDTGRGWTG
jgi:hypothetical protein